MTKHSSLWRFAGVFLATLLIASSSAIAQEKAEAEKDQGGAGGPPRAESREAQVETGGGFLIRLAAPSDYWIGLQLDAVPDDVRAHVDIPADQGLYVGEVIADGPAAKAGLKQHDILLEADGKPLKQVSDLADAIEARQEKPLSVKLTRQGKIQTVEITPAKRPAQGNIVSREKENARRVAVQALRRAELARDESLQQLERARREAREAAERVEEAVEGPLRIQFFHPGMVLPFGAAARPPFDDDVSVTITKKGKAPAKVEVHKGDESWTVTDEELDKLPESVRGQVQGLLGRPSQNVSFTVWSNNEGPEAEGQPEQPRKKGLPAAAIPVAPGVRQKSERRRDRELNEVERQLEALRRQVEKMRTEQKREPGPTDDRQDGRAPEDRKTRAADTDR
jgi:hypothetical protein